MVATFEACHTLCPAFNSLISPMCSADLTKRLKLLFITRYITCFPNEFLSLESFNRTFIIRVRVRRAIERQLIEYESLLLGKIGPNQPIVRICQICYLTY